MTLAPSSDLQWLYLLSADEESNRYTAAGTGPDEDDGGVPEGDTVYALARRLDSALRDRVLTHGDLRVPAHATADLAGHTVLAHVTHGKHLLTRLSGDLTLHTHLRMSGSWTISSSGRWLPPGVMP